ncbi:MAG TPA: alpha/beta hydrolase, partial [Cyanobacteria bacterium UBA8543]|nr:alpha/beta hydrolase [Cyanobacteria bacterium UBA8543]
MSTFCLVHGAFLGAWCWEKLIPHLEGWGHHAIAMDLPLEDPEAGAVRYAEAVLQTLKEVDDDVVLVGHSMTGLFIPLIASQRKVRKLVFLAGGIPKVGTSVTERLSSSEPDMFNPDGVDQDPSQDEAVATKLLFNDCEPDVARWAVSKLRFQASRLIFSEVSPLQVWPDVESSYILCTDDQTFTPGWSRRTAREILGVDAIELPGGHCPQ